MCHLLLVLNDASRLHVNSFIIISIFSALGDLFSKQVEEEFLIVCDVHIFALSVVPSPGAHMQILTSAC